jgi:hypothetical protein
VGAVVAADVAVAVPIGWTAQIGPWMVLPINVTSAVCAKARPFKVAPSAIVIEVSAKIFPMNDAPEPRVAVLPTLHHTLQGSPPVTEAPEFIVSPDTVLKIQTPDPLRVRFPVNEKLLVEQ